MLYVLFIIFSYIVFQSFQLFQLCFLPIVMLWEIRCPEVSSKGIPEIRERSTYAMIQLCSFMEIPTPVDQRASANNSRRLVIEGLIIVRAGSPKCLISIVTIISIVTLITIVTGVTI